MKLKRFDLYLRAPHRDTRSAFNYEARHVSALYERHFPGLQTDCWKIAVDAGAVIDDARVIIDDVTMVQVELDYAAYTAAQIPQRKAMILEALHAGAMRAADALSLPAAPFEVARAAVVERSFVNEWTWKKTKASPDRLHRVSLFCVHEIDAFRAWLVIRDRRGQEHARKPAFVAAPDEFIFAPKMGQLEWTSPTRAVLLDKKKEEVNWIALDERDN